MNPHHTAGQGMGRLLRIQPRVESWEWCWGMLEMVDGVLIRLGNKLMAVIPMESRVSAWWDPEREWGNGCFEMFWGVGGKEEWVLLKPP